MKLFEEAQALDAGRRLFGRMATKPVKGDDLVPLDEKLSSVDECEGRGALVGRARGCDVRASVVLGHSSSRVWWRRDRRAAAPALPASEVDPANTRATHEREPNVKVLRVEACIWECVEEGLGQTLVMGVLPSERQQIELAFMDIIK